MAETKKTSSIEKPNHIEAIRNKIVPQRTTFEKKQLCLLKPKNPREITAERCRHSRIATSKYSQN